MRRTSWMPAALVGAALVSLALSLAGCASDGEGYRSPYEGSMSVPDGKAFPETPEEKAERRARVRAPNEP